MYKEIASIAVYAIGQLLILVIVDDSIPAFEIEPLELQMKYLAFAVMSTGLLSSAYLLGIRPLLPLAKHSCNSDDNANDIGNENK